MSQKKPLLIYDGECSFCLFWIHKWQKFTKEQVEYVAYQSLEDQSLNISNEEFEKSIKLVENKDNSISIYSAAEAAFKALAYNPKFKFLFWLYSNLPGFKWFSELLYSLIANNRKTLSKLMRISGMLVPISTSITQNIFTRSLGLIYFIAFASLLVQIKGLIGKNGILPIAEYVPLVKQVLLNQAYKFPTLFWFNTSDGFIISLLVLGLLFSALLVLNLFPRLTMFATFCLYLSFVTVGRDFLSFQWDILLLEAGFLGFLLSLFPTNSFFNSAALFLLRFLVFKLMFMSGVVKLSSGDPSWHNLTALNYHYETQPIPNAIAFYTHQLPEQFQKLSTIIMFAVELVLPWFIFFGRNARLFAFIGFTIFQLLIITTGNYCFFNLLSIFLSFLLLDDNLLKRYLPFVFWGGLDKESEEQQVSSQRQPKNGGLINLFSKSVKSFLFMGIFFCVISINIFYICRAFNRSLPAPQLITKLLRIEQPFHLINPYGLFAVMTTKRNEIIIEGSDDGKTWLEYEFKWKPGNQKRMPAQVAPHQPRLDWQMWFAALGQYKNQMWFKSFMLKLLDGSPDVLRLMENNPFPKQPPKFIRALFYEYKFTNLEIQKKTGKYWERELKGLYMPPVYKQL